MSRFPNGSYEEQYAPFTLEQIEAYDEIHYDLSHSFSFPFICYFFKISVQKYPFEYHKKTPVLEFFLKKQRLQVFKKGLRQSFFPVKFVKFFRTTFF